MSLEVDRARATAAILADPHRAQLLCRLVQGPGYPTDLARDLGLSAQNVSKHLTRLQDGGLVRSCREGRRFRYEAAGENVARLLHDLAEVGTSTVKESS